MQVLVILNADVDVGRRSETALRLAGALARNDDTDVRLFIVGDDPNRVDVRAPIDHDTRVARLVGDLVAAGVEVRATTAGRHEDGAGSAVDGVLGVEPSTIRGLSEWTIEADRVLVF